MTAALEAAEVGALKVLRALYAHGALLTLKNSHGDGALELARWARDGERVRAWLRASGVQPNEPEEDERYQAEDTS